MSTNSQADLKILADFPNAAEGERSQITVDAPRLKNVTFSPGFKVGKLLFISGQVSIDPEGNIVGRGDFAAQCKQVFQNIGLVLDRASFSFSDIVKLTAYITDLRNYPTYAKIRGDLFREQYPASTVIGIASLIHEGLMLEVEGIAVLK
jgi:2-iminobutanoate/2-iminopropanoate deaminase